MGAKFFNYAKHGVCETSGVTASICGHLYHLKADVDIDNGSVVALGDFVKGEVWKAKIPAKTDKVILINTSVVIYETYTKKCQEESNFFNEKGETMRGFEVRVTDTFTLSEECFEENSTPAAGKYVSVDGIGYKLTVSDTAPTDTAFVGYIYDIAPNGNFRIIVQKNDDNFTPAA